ncbi:serine hydrolase domain-containing protein [Paraburkholderia megapolitana]|uniref:CubicO group peptidase, beta-lactamase class C family n=1 Tax=Paraburkholderia megapolitana TaxID=420953 RepID=A0A1I3KNG6_9BURK|nr:serine hydrolase domain-containing protein [Paraburkholderia megapolitana]QDQ80396.1 beta-lactamase family protein [Paraburkholderia megapolitana]SFI73900.1 CubicO group peptidase, beta-lactamase class C family [Paraburkholderia megapolitana]
MSNPDTSRLPKDAHDHVETENAHIEGLATELLNAINSFSRQSIRNFLVNNTNLPTSNDSLVDESVAWLHGFARLSGRLTLREIVSPTTDSPWVVRVEDAVYSLPHLIHIQIQPDGGGKIIGLNLLPGELEDDPITLETAVEQSRRFCESGTKADVFSGAVLVARGPDVLFEYVSGHVDKRHNVPNNLDTRFNLGSINKMFTAIAIAQLVEQGRLGFMDTIDRYIDETWLPESVTKEITVHHLLSHSSGLGSFFNETFTNGSRARFRNIADYKQLIKDDRPSFTPGERFEYSNTGMLLAGVIVERVTGVSYYDYVRDAIYAPCGMNHTDCFDIDAPVPNLAMGYIPEIIETSMQSDRPFVRWRENIFEHVAKGGPAGGGFSTVRDLRRFADALLADTLVSRSMRDTLWTDHYGAGYGYGFEVVQHAGEKSIGHSGGFAGISASFLVGVDTGLVEVLLSNHDAGVFGLERFIYSTFGRVRF